MGAEEEDAALGDVDGEVAEEGGAGGFGGGEEGAELERGVFAPDGWGGFEVGVVREEVGGKHGRADEFGGCVAVGVGLGVTVGLGGFGAYWRGHGDWVEGFHSHGGA